MNDAIRTIHDEHRSISAVLSGLKELSRMARASTAHPDFRVFRAMLRYIDEFPEKLHHPKEDQYLFARLAERAPGARQLIRELKDDHVKGARLVRELERALVLYEDRWPAGAGEFIGTVDLYAEFHWRHMRREEQELLPLAEKMLSEQDWREIGEAFASNKDPLAGRRERDFEQLFSRIASLAPAPVGLGEPWKHP